MQNINFLFMRRTQTEVYESVFIRRIVIKNTKLHVQNESHNRLFVQPSDRSNINHEIISIH